MYPSVLVAKPEERAHMGDIKRYTCQDNTKWTSKKCAVRTAKDLMRIL
jgi:hypothetical protein